MSNLSVVKRLWSKHRDTVLGIPAIGLAIPILFKFPDFHYSIELYLKHAFNSTLHTATIWLGATYIFEKISENKPGYQESIKRVILLIGSITLYTAIVVLGLVFIFCWNFEENFSWKLYLEDFKTSFIVTFMVSAVFEARFFFKNWKEVIVENERLQKQNVIAQYETLKSQVNPHFLFNSLNSLSSLIHIDVDKSEKFIEEFAKVYRYLLDTMGKTVVLLKEELTFVQSYVFLQKIRFEENLQVEIKIDSDHLNKLIPPVALQLLVENAIKHNIASSHKVLFVEIFVEDGFLTIENNLQLREDRRDSTGVGLRNLREKYEIISKMKPEFFATSDKYIAKIPLILEES